MRSKTPDIAGNHLEVLCAQEKPDNTYAVKVCYEKSVRHANPGVFTNVPAILGSGSAVAHKKQQQSRSQDTHCILLSGDLHIVYHVSSKYIAYSKRRNGDSSTLLTPQTNHGCRGLEFTYAVQGTNWYVVPSAEWCVVHLLTTRIDLLCFYSHQRTRARAACKVLYLCLHYYYISAITQAYATAAASLSL